MNLAELKAAIESIPERPIAVVHPDRQLREIEGFRMVVSPYCPRDKVLIIREPGPVVWSTEP